MENSILSSVKKLLGISDEYEHFDMDIIMHINSVFMILWQMGIGPTECFTIHDKTAMWTDFTSGSRSMEPIKTYVYMKVRMMFDPPTGSLLEALKNNISELEWRLYTDAEFGGGENSK